MSYTTSELVTAVRTSFGEDTPSTSAIQDTQIVQWLNEAQRELCWEGDLLMSCGRGSTVAGQATYDLPPDYLRMSAVYIYRPASFTVGGCTTAGLSTDVSTSVTDGFLGVAGGFPVTATGVDTTVSSILSTTSIRLNVAVNLAVPTTLTFTNPNGGFKYGPLTNIGVSQLDSERTPSPNQYAFWIWGENVSTMNRPVLGLQDIPSTSNPYDIHIFYRQLPQVMAVAGTAPEIPFQWQDGLIVGALMRAYFRLSLTDTKWLALYDRANARWETVKARAKQTKNPFTLGRPRSLASALRTSDWYLWAGGEG